MEVDGVVKQQASPDAVSDPDSDVVTTVEAYEAWVDTLIPTVASARRDKHALMAASPFAFLRASYPRWAQRVGHVAGEPPGPLVSAVGDLHVENFGTWRDAQGRLAWGVNDLDEADRLPAAFDLVRLCTSALLANADRNVPLSAKNIVATVLAGYAAAADSGGHPFVLDRPKPRPLEPLLPPEHPARWWKKINDLKPATATLPDDARALLMASLPRGVVPVTLFGRVAGMGSRDHVRIVARVDLAGSPVVREIKAMSPPATWWLSGTPSGGVAGRTASSILRRARRSPDPGVRISASWVVRRLASWSDRIELVDLHKHVDADELLSSMGAETANLHLASATTQALEDLTTPVSRKWIKRAAERMIDDTVDDWRAWRKAMSKKR
jgi:hypothetical protein